MPKPSIRTTIVLPPELYEQIEAARDGMTFTAWLIEAIKRELEREQAQQQRQEGE